MAPAKYLSATTMELHFASSKASSAAVHWLQHTTSLSPPLCRKVMLFYHGLGKIMRATAKCTKIVPKLPSPPAQVSEGKGRASRRLKAYPLSGRPISRASMAVPLRRGMILCTQIQVLMSYTMIDTVPQASLPQERVTGQLRTA